MMNKLIVLLLLFLLLSIQKVNAQQIDLAGQWKFSLDAQDQWIKEKWFNQTLKQTIKLPGTTDEAGFGTPNALEPKLEKPQLLHLTRKNNYVGVSWSLQKVSKASQLTVSLKIEGTNYENKWKIWVYPSACALIKSEVVITQSFEEAALSLAAGESVLLPPDWHKLKGIEGKFVPVFWSPIHVPSQAGTMGYYATQPILLSHCFQPK